MHMSNVRFHLKRRHKRFVKLCNTCNSDIVDRVEYKESHGVRCGNSRLRKRVREVNDQAWKELYAKLAPTEEQVLHDDLVPTAAVVHANQSYSSTMANDNIIDGTTIPAVHTHRTVYPSSSSISNTSASLPSNGHNSRVRDSTPTITDKSLNLIRTVPTRESLLVSNPTDSRRTKTRNATSCICSLPLQDEHLRRSTLPSMTTSPSSSYHSQTTQVVTAPSLELPELHHANMNHPSATKNDVDCPYMCGVKITGAHAAGNLNRHYKTIKCAASGRAKSKHPCQSKGCQKLFARSDALRVHMRKEHGTAAAAASIYGSSI
ncbi:hypothetical protein BKA63DRAFT_527413 [Paraphoma chrysanthemicola]|nr:hypothetical protein BKA63DRAFT_527413 [Paraphoma chrysanthemicola]